jgi:hypothetical protein
MNVSGTVTSSTIDYRTNKVFLRFATGAALELVDHVGSTVLDEYTYLVPNVMNGSVTVMASEEGPNGIGLAHRDNLAPGQSGVDITIPDPVVLISPTIGTLTPTTEFRWSDDANAYVFHIEDYLHFQGITVVTGSNRMTLPVIDGYTLDPDEAHYWYVMTHGNPTSVDDLVGPTGFADPFGRSFGDAPDSPAAPRDGSYTISLSRDITTPP